MNIAVSEHIHLSEMRSADKAALIEHLQEKAIYERTLRIPYPYTEGDADAWLARVERAAREGGPFAAMAIRNEAGSLIGACGFDGLVEGKAHRVELGYWLARPYWGRGIMTAVVSRACAFAFAQFGLVKIAAHVFAGNVASARVLEKCGFEQEGYLRKHYVKDGQFVDVRLFALLK